MKGTTQFAVLTPSSESWRERFDEEFGEFCSELKNTVKKMTGKEIYPAETIKSFIEKELSSVRESTLKEAEEMWRPTLEWWKNHGTVKCNYDECYCQSAWEMVLFEEIRESTLLEVEGKYKEIFSWLNGEPDFRERAEGEGAYWWRNELRDRLAKLRSTNN